MVEIVTLSAEKEKQTSWSQIERKIVDIYWGASPSTLNEVLTEQEKVTLIATSFSVSWGNLNVQRMFFNYLQLLTSCPASTTISEDVKKCFRSLPKTALNDLTNRAPKTQGHDLVNPNSILDELDKATEFKNTVRPHIYEYIKKEAVSEGKANSISSIRNLAAYLGMFDSSYIYKYRAFIGLPESKQKEMKTKGKEIVEKSTANQQ